jgi:CRP-like cAMP-binding protein
MKSPFIVNKLDDQTIKQFTEICPPRIFNTETEIIYEGHIPTAGYLLLEGKVHFVKRKRVVQIVGANCIFGISELMNNQPLKYTVRIEPGAQVCILDKSSIKEILSLYSIEQLPKIFKELVA